MRAFFLTFFTLLLSSSSSNGFDTNLNSEIAPKFTNLNSDVLYTILYKLEIHELMNTAEAFPELSNLIDEVFRRKFQKNQTLVKLWISDPSDSAEHVINFDDNTIIVNGHDDSINMLTRFGPFLQNVSISYRTMACCPEIINRYLNVHCSKSLKKLEVIFYYLNSLEQLTTPFEGVEEFSGVITGSGLKVSRPLNELFPNLRRLNLKLHSNVDISFIDGHFPNLNHFDFSVSRGTHHKQFMAFIEQLKRMILKNPKIQSVGMYLAYPPDFLKFLNTALPNLEHLKLNNLEIDRSDIVQFQNVKKFDLILYHTVSTIDLENLSLPNLESLEIDISKCFDEWIKFFGRHTHLRQLQVKDDTFLLNTIQSNILVTVLPNVVDFTISIRHYYGTEPVAQFIRNYEHFEKIQLLLYEKMAVPETDITALQRQFQNKWTVKAIEGIRSGEKTIVGISFERK